MLFVPITCSNKQAHEALTPTIISHELGLQFHYRLVDNLRRMTGYLLQASKPLGDTSFERMTKFAPRNIVTYRWKSLPLRKLVS